MRRWSLGKYRNLLIGVAAAQVVALAATLAVGLHTTRSYESLVVDYSLSRDQAAGSEAVAALLWSDHVDRVARTGPRSRRRSRP